jgi:hypothetical protein
MNPADQRLTELVDKWLKSLELHLKYAGLTEEAYWQVQPWVRHQRPARWILDLAHARARELKRQLEQRLAAGDTGFAEGLELVAFLANLVGVQNIERFIPLAEPQRENAEALGQTQSTLQTIGTTSTQSRTLIEPTREMRIPVLSTPAELEPPARVTLLQPAPAPPPAAPAAPEVPAAAAPSAPSAPRASPPPSRPGGTATVEAPAEVRNSSSGRPAAKRDTRAAAPKQPRPPATGGIEAQIVADAVRLLKWGRAWHELAEAIARIADRPGVVEVRKCLRTHKVEIERAARS